MLHGGVLVRIEMGIGFPKKEGEKSREEAIDLCNSNNGVVRWNLWMSLYWHYQKYVACALPES